MSKSYTEEWLEAVAHTREIYKRWPKAPAQPVEPSHVSSTTWKPWNKMTAEERRKAWEGREKPISSDT